MIDPSITQQPAWLRFLPHSIRRRLTGRTSLLAIIHNSGWLLLDKMVRIFLGLIVGAWVARYLGPSRFGELAYILAYISFFQAIASLGLDGIVVRDIAQNRNSAGVVLGTTFFLRLFFGVICWLLAIIGMALLHGIYDKSVILTVLVGGALVFQAADTVDLWFQSQSQSRRTVVAKMGAYILSNGIRVVLVFAEAPLFAFAALLSVEAAVAAGGLYFSYKKYPCGARWTLLLGLGRRLVGESWFFALAGLVNMLQARVEFFVIESNLGMDSVGQYAAALRIIEVFDIVGVTIALSVFPKLASQHPSRQDWAIRRTYLVMVGVYLLSLPAMLIAPWVLIILYGPQYETAKAIFLFMIFRPFFAYLGLVRGMSIRLDGRASYSALCAIIGASLAYGLATFFVPRYGLYGAVGSAALSYLVSNVVLDVIFYRKNFINMVFCAR